jgi:energy-coupling factor transporter transmembrane protein EcfT
MSESPSAPAGWYPVDGGQERYWDGAAWTAELRPSAASGTAPTTPAAASTASVAAPSADSVGTPAPTTEKPKPAANVLGLIALGCAVIGFIFACIPGALIVGWVLLPIAFILGIVGLFMSGKAKWPAIAAIIVSVVGTIVAFVVFFAVVFTAADEAFGGTPVEVESSESAPAEDSASEEPADDDAAAGLGSRENPAALGSTITGDDWTVVVNSFTADANQAVADANVINQPAPAGTHYSSVNYTVTYTGEESGIAALVGMALVTSTGEVIENYDSMAFLGDAMGIDELYNGGTATGSAVFEVPDGAEVLIRVTPGMLADEVFVTP